MRIGFYNPYLRTLGGGERVLLSVLEHYVNTTDAECVLLGEDQPDSRGWRNLDVDVEAQRFQWRYARRRDVPGYSRDLDALLSMSNDFPPRSRASNSVVILQFPTRSLRRVTDRVARHAVEMVGYRDGVRGLDSYDTIVCYSRFVQRQIRERLHRAAVVVYPPVSVPAAVSRHPRKDILAVGRFFQGWHNKKHDVLIEAFRRVVASTPAARDWRLHLVGSAQDDAPTQEYLADLKHAADGLPVVFHVNADAAELKALYQCCSLFWHATGYGEDESRHPERSEHFGITTVEAMSHGVVPLVIDAGAQCEIVSHEQTGILWRGLDELVTSTVTFIEEPALVEPMRTTARRASERFSKGRFQREMTSLLTPTLRA